MPIEFLPEKQLFFLQAGNSSYVLHVLPFGRLVHLSWGPRLKARNLDGALAFRDRPFSPIPEDIDGTYSLDSLPLEHPVSGTGDYRSPALEIYQRRTVRAFSTCVTGATGSCPANRRCPDCPPPLRRKTRRRR